MPDYLGSEGFHHGTQEKLGVLLANLGTPDAPETGALRRYLAEFLWDPRVVEVPRPLWWLILHGVILRIRPRRSAEAYRQVWTPEGSPLLTWSRRQAEGLSARLEKVLPGPAQVVVGMRYGNPSIPSALEELRAANCRRILVLPMYPQYSASTTGSTFDAVAATLGRWRWVPDLRFINHYHDEPGYIRALAASLRDHWETQGRGEKLLMSFHGVPRRYLLSGDPYHCQCHKTARLVAEELGLAEGQWAITFQSRFGREEWLKPYTDETVRSLGAEGLKSLDVVCPGFAADCLETLEEIAQQNAEFFHEAGGEKLTYVPALNARDDHLDFLADLVVRNLGGWPEADAGWSAEARARESGASRERALALGGGAC
jgi:ferrochelatase